MAKRQWTITLKAKGIQQVIRRPFCTPFYSTIHELATGSYVENLFDLISANEANFTATAVFTRSRNRKIGKATDTLLKQYLEVR